MTFEEALKTAKELKPNIDKYSETTSAYIFACKAEDFDIGGDGPVVIMKDSGKALNYVGYIQTRPDDDEEIKLNIDL